MGYFVSILIFFLIRFFELIGEAIIQILHFGVNLIVLSIKSITFVGKITFACYYFFRLNIKKSWNFFTLFIKRTIRQSITFTQKLPTPLSSLPIPSLPIPRFMPKAPRKPEVAFIVGFSVAILVAALAGSVYIAINQLPNPHLLTNRAIPVTTKLFDRHGILLYEIYADENRTPVTLADIPSQFKDATLAIEDKDFYHHQGFSFSGIARALYSIAVTNQMQGGSTITQQLVRSALLTQEVTISRKLKELALSIWTERIYSKDQILEMYFNQVPYGGTAWGAEAAAQMYFGKSIKDVDLAEASLLAGLPAAPSRFSPFGAHPELARARQKEVLRRMVEEGSITAQEKEIAATENLTFKRPDVGIQAPHFVMYVKDLLSQKYGIHTVEQGGLRVTTTLDLSIQNNAQEIVAKEVAGLKRLNVGNGAAVVANPKNGEILAMVGSTDYFNIEKEGNVNVALTPQQPGSTIKAVTYAVALQQGFTPATLLPDIPKTYQSPGGQAYTPVNYDGKFHGLVPLRFALGNSYNVAAVYTLSKIGVQSLIDEGKKMGISSWNKPENYGLSLTLGGADVTMLDMTEAYATLANGGTQVPLTALLEVTDYQGRPLENNWFPRSEKVLPADVAFIISDILADNNARSSAFGTSSALSIPGQWVPVKTGTSNDKRDNWTIGYTKDFVVTVWVGNNDNSPMNPILTSGITGASPIWRKITDSMLAQYPSTPPAPPTTIVALNCRGRNEYFIAGTEKNACAPIPKPSGGEDQVAQQDGFFSVNAQEPNPTPTLRQTQPDRTQESIKRFLEQVNKAKKKRN